MEAQDLYQGDHWSVVRQVISQQDSGIRVWIASAGCGLISPQTHVPSYRATFRSNEIDSVAGDADERRRWWHGLTQLSFETAAPRTVTDLVHTYPTSTMLIAASPDYLTAMSRDMENALKAMSERNRFIVLCRKGVRLDGLEEAQVELGANLSTAVGGSMTSLNARMIRFLIRRLGISFDRTTVQAEVEELRSHCKLQMVAARRKSSDEQISAFIRDALKRNPSISGSAALTAFRDAGKAAEQRRFQSLFRSSQQEVLIG